MLEDKLPANAIKVDQYPPGHRRRRLPAIDGPARDWVIIFEITVPKDATQERFEENVKRILPEIKKILKDHNPGEFKIERICSPRDPLDLKDSKCPQNSTFLGRTKSWMKDHPVLSIACGGVLAVGASWFLGWWRPFGNSQPVHRYVPSVSADGWLSSVCSYVINLPTWCYWLLAGPAVWGVRYCCSKNPDDDSLEAGCAARTSLAPIVRKMTQTTGMSPNLIIFLIVLFFVVLAALFGCCYLCSRKAPIQKVIQPLEEIVVDDKNKNGPEASRLLYGSQSKSERLGRFRKIFKHQPGQHNAMYQAKREEGPLIPLYAG